MMNYKETLFFVGKCLTITHAEHNKVIVAQEIKAGKVDWDNVVKTSTKHYVLPALYCNLKRVNFLQYLPTKLVEYMKFITDLNRERNDEIITQTKDINTVLLKNNITPIFLKGAAFLLGNLYQNIADRMVGDIDFLVSKEAYKKAITILKDDGYYLLISNSKDVENSKHYPRMVKKNCVNAIEIHREMTLKKHRALFNYEFVLPSIITKNKISFMSFKHQILHTIINKQLNDFGYTYKNIALRNYYDLFLLSYKANTLASIHLLPSLKKPLNSFLSNASSIFNTPGTIAFEKNKHAIKHTSSAVHYLNISWFSKFRIHFIRLKRLTIMRATILVKALYHRESFWFVIDRITDINWYKRRF